MNKCVMGCYWYNTKHDYCQLCATDEGACKDNDFRYYKNPAEEAIKFGRSVLGSKPIHEGDSCASSFVCSNCDFPKNDTLTTDMKYCFNCGTKLDWSDFV